MNKEQWAQRAHFILKHYEDVTVTIPLPLFHLFIMMGFLAAEDTRQEEKSKENMLNIALDMSDWMVQLVPEMEELYDNLPEH